MSAADIISSCCLVTSPDSQLAACSCFFPSLDVARYTRKSYIKRGHVCMLVHFKYFTLDPSIAISISRRLRKPGIPPTPKDTRHTACRSRHRNPNSRPFPDPQAPIGKRRVQSWNPSAAEICRVSLSSAHEELQLCCCTGIQGRKPLWHPQLLSSAHPTSSKPDRDFDCDSATRPSKAFSRGVLGNNRPSSPHRAQNL
jgi:hypothetical protein